MPTIEQRLDALALRVTELTEQLDEIEDGYRVFYTDQRVHMTQWLEQNVGTFIRDQYLRTLRDLQQQNRLVPDVEGEALPVRPPNMRAWDNQWVAFVPPGRDNITGTNLVNTTTVER